jgi:hypothetical protein
MVALINLWLGLLVKSRKQGSFVLPAHPAEGYKGRRETSGGRAVPRTIIFGKDT